MHGNQHWKSGPRSRHCLTPFAPCRMGQQSFPPHGRGQVKGRSLRGQEAKV